MTESRDSGTADVGNIGGFGALVLADLENRAERAYVDHTDGYTASSVLHTVWMDQADEDIRKALDLIFAALERYHAKTRKVWHDLYDTWAVAAGFQPIIDEPDEDFGTDLGSRPDSA